MVHGLSGPGTEWFMDEWSGDRVGHGLSGPGTEWSGDRVVQGPNGPWTNCGVTCAVCNAFTG